MTNNMGWQAKKRCTSLHEILGSFGVAEIYFFIFSYGLGLGGGAFFNSIITKKKLCFQSKHFKTLINMQYSTDLIIVISF